MQHYSMPPKFSSKAKFGDEKNYLREEKLELNTSDPVGSSTAPLGPYVKEEAKSNGFLILSENDFSKDYYSARLVKSGRINSNTYNIDADKGRVPRRVVSRLSESGLDIGNVKYQYGVYTKNSDQSLEPIYEAAAVREKVREGGGINLSINHRVYFEPLYSNGFAADPNLNDGRGRARGHGSGR